MTESSPRPESLRQLEHEVGVLVRRVRHVIGERARAVHEDLQPSAYLMLTYLVEQGPLRPSVASEAFSIDKGAISRQIQHLLDLGLVVRTADPDDGRASLVSASDDAVRRMADVSEHRRKWLDERLGDWSDQELSGFADVLGRYNETLNRG